MRPGPTSFVLLLAIGLSAGCSRRDNADVGQDLKSAGQDISHAAGRVARDPDVKSAGAELKAAGQDFAKDVRHAGDQAKSATQDFAGQTKSAAHDVTHDTSRHRDRRNDNS